MTEHSERYSEARGTCAYPGCARPAAEGVLRGCAEHTAAYDAASELEALEFAQRILEPWYAATTAIGHEELTEAMDRAMDHLDEELKKARAEVERAEAAL